MVSENAAGTMPCCVLYFHMDGGYWYCLTGSLHWFYVFWRGAAGFVWERHAGQVRSWNKPAASSLTARQHIFASNPYLRVNPECVGTWKTPCVQYNLLQYVV